MKKQLLILAAALSFCACTDDSEEFEVINNLPVFTAETDAAETRTQLDGLKFLWNKGDQVTMYLKNYLPIDYQVTAGEGTTRATLTPTRQEDAGAPLWKHNIAVYSKFSRIKLTYRDSEHTYYIGNIEFPQDCIYGKDGSEPGSGMPMIAVSTDDQLQFKNMGAVLKFKVRAGNGSFGPHTRLWKIKVRGLNNEFLSGGAIAAYESNTGALKKVEPGRNYAVNAKRENDEDFILSETTATEIYLIIPPTNFTKGMQIELYDDHSDDMTLKTKPLNIERNKMYVFPEIEFIPFKMGGTLPDIHPEPASL